MQQHSSIETRFKDYLHETRIEGLFDSKGTEFRAYTDAVYEGILIELKEYPLNTVRTIDACVNKLSAQLAFRVPFYKNNPEEIPRCQYQLSSLLWDLGHYHDCLKWAFNHSAQKQSIVSKKLREQGKRLIIIFSKHPSHVQWRGKKLPFKEFYKSVFELEVMLESEFWQQVSRKEPVAA